jgi:hypothetical protein
LIKKVVILIPKIKKNFEAQQLFRTDSIVAMDGDANILGVLNLLRIPEPVQLIGCYHPAISF